MERVVDIPFIPNIFLIMYDFSIAWKSIDLVLFCSIASEASYVYHQIYFEK